MRAIGNGWSCSNPVKRTRCSPCRIRLEVPSPRPTQARMRPTVATWRKSVGARQSGPRRIDHGDAEHAWPGERVLEHGAIPHFENAERQQSVREEKRARQRHHRDGVGKFDRIGHGVGTSGRSSKYDTRHEPGRDEETSARSAPRAEGGGPRRGRVGPRWWHGRGARNSKPSRAGAVRSWMRDPVSPVPWR